MSRNNSSIGWSQIAVILILFILFGCAQNEPDNLSVFTQDERKELMNILASFDELVLDYTKEKDTVKAYNEFLELTELDSVGYDLTENYRETIKPFTKGALKIYNDLEGEAIIDQLWDYGHAFRDTNPDDTLWVYSRFKYDGKYLKFLEKKSLGNEFLSDYTDAIKAVGSVNNQSMMNSIPQNKEVFDLTNIEDRLVIAMHFISLCAVPLIEQERKAKEEVKDERLKVKDESDEEEERSYEESMKIENYIIEKVPAGSEVFPIMDNVIVFIDPDQEEITKMKEELGEDFYTVADDNMFYNFEASEYMRSKGVNEIHTVSRYIEFTRKDNSKVYVDTKAPVAWGWICMIFRTDSMPKVINTVDIEEEYKIYFGENN